MDWKQQIAKWSREWQIDPPTFVFSDKELRKLLSTDYSWNKFKSSRPDLFTGDPDEDSDEELKEIFRDCLSPFLVRDRVLGVCGGLFKILNGDMSLLIISHTHIHDKRTLRHEFHHRVSLFYDLFSEDEEEAEASWAEHRRGWNELFERRKTFKVRSKMFFRKFKGLRRRKR